MRLGLTIPYTTPLHRPAILALARAAERLGYETLRIAEHNGWDPFPVLAHLASVTERIKLGTGVAGVFGRSPAQLAQAAVTVDAISRGRLVLGLGTSGPLFVRACLRLVGCLVMAFGHRRVGPCDPPVRALPPRLRRRPTLAITAGPRWLGPAPPVDR